MTSKSSIRNIGPSPKSLDHILRIQQGAIKALSGYSRQVKYQAQFFFSSLINFLPLSPARSVLPPSLIYSEIRVNRSNLKLVKKLVPSKGINILKE